MDQALAHPLTILKQGKHGQARWATNSWLIFRRRIQTSAMPVEPLQDDITKGHRWRIKTEGRAFSVRLCKPVFDRERDLFEKTHDLCSVYAQFFYKGISGFFRKIILITSRWSLHFWWWGSSGATWTHHFGIKCPDGFWAFTGGNVLRLWCLWICDA